MCPDGWYGYAHVCHETCPTGTASDLSNLCVSDCDHDTFNEGGVCVTNCTTDYADPDTHMCSASCQGGRYADPNTHRCVEVCPDGWYRDPTFVCSDDCSVGGRRADNITLTCTDKCSDGLWGYQNKCIEICPPLTYGYLPDRDCYDIASIPDPALFADNITQTWVSQCSESPLMFGDTLLHECVLSCDQPYYADPESQLCETACTNSSFYLDETTNSCVLVCPEGYQSNPSSGTCQQNCTHSLYDYPPTHSCVVNCPKPYYGYDNET